MADYDSGCRGKAWIGGAVAGLLVFFFVLAVSHMGFGAAVFLGALTFLFLGALFVWAFCSGRSIAFEAPRAAAPAPVMAPVAPAPVQPAPVQPVVAPAPAAPVMAPVAEVKAEAPVAPAVQAEAPKAKPAAKPKAEKPAAEAPAKAPKKAAAKKASDGKPKGLKAPRKGKPDDLKLIEGIGPKLEERLNEWGVFHYDQIAAWGAEEVAYADANVPRFKGRASRDKWVAQAKIIVEEGLERFLERAKTNDY